MKDKYKICNGKTVDLEEKYTVMISQLFKSTHLNKTMIL